MLSQHQAYAAKHLVSKQNQKSDHERASYINQLELQSFHDVLNCVARIN